MSDVGTGGLREAVKGAVARGWCKELNRAKEMDSDLAEAITEEILPLVVEPTRQVKQLQEALERARGIDGDAMPAPPDAESL